MKIIHTSDWHLGGSWNGHDRTEDLFEQVDKVCAIVTEIEANVLLVVGDIFERVSREKLHRNSRRLAEKLKGILANGCHVILVPGNHDFRDHFKLMKTFLELESGKTDRIHIVEAYEEFEIDDVQFIVLPYPDREVLEEIGKYEASTIIGKAERNKALSDTLADSIREIDSKINPEKPAVFVTHLQIIGVNYSGTPKEATYNEDLSLASNCLPQNVAYIALGHIHKCQEIEKSAAPCWYSGSFDRMDLGERDDEKYLLLVEINGNKKATIEKIPINSHRFEIVFICADELEQVAMEFENREEVYGNITIKYTADDDVLALNRRTHQLLPKFRVTLQPEGTELVETGEIQNAYNSLETVHQYLESQFGDNRDLLAELTTRAKLLILEVENAFEKN